MATIGSAKASVRASSIVHGLWDHIFEGTQAVLLALCASAFFIQLCSSAIALEDECGGLKVPGYTARRISGSWEFRVAVSPDKERMEDIGGPGLVRILDLATMGTLMLDPKKKLAVAVPPPPKPSPAKQEGVETFIDREHAKNGLVIVTIGLKTPKGKDWVAQTSCRPDGIWVERKNKAVPKGLGNVKQTDIKIESIPVSWFEMPGDYKLVKQPQ